MNAEQEKIIAQWYSGVIPNIRRFAELILAASTPALPGEVRLPGPRGDGSQTKGTFSGGWNACLARVRELNPTPEGGKCEWYIQSFEPGDGSFAYVSACASLWHNGGMLPLKCPRCRKVVVEIDPPKKRTVIPEDSPKERDPRLGPGLRTGAEINATPTPQASTDVEVQRWKHTADNQMVTEPDGEYVRYEDYLKDVFVLPRLSPDPPPASTVEREAKILTDSILGENGFVCQNTTGNPVEQLFNGVKAAYLAGASSKPTVNARDLARKFTRHYPVLYGNQTEQERWVDRLEVLINAGARAAEAQYAATYRKAAQLIADSFRKERERAVREAFEAGMRQSPGDDEWVSLCDTNNEGEYIRLAYTQYLSTLSPDNKEEV